MFSDGPGLYDDPMYRRAFTYVVRLFRNGCLLDAGIFPDYEDAAVLACDMVLTYGRNPDFFVMESLLIDWDETERSIVTWHDEEYEVSVQARPIKYPKEETKCKVIPFRRSA